MWVIRWFFTLLVLVVLIIFSIANLNFTTSLVLVPGYLEYRDVSVIWIVAMSFIIGMLVSFLIAVVNYFQMSRLVKRKDQELVQLKKELAVMRNMPLDDETAPATEGE
jgi:uncharacterized integral membrane protein